MEEEKGIKTMEAEDAPFSQVVHLSSPSTPSTVYRDLKVDGDEEDEQAVHEDVEPLTEEQLAQQEKDDQLFAARVAGACMGACAGSFVGIPIIGGVVGGLTLPMVAVRDDVHGRNARAIVAKSQKWIKVAKACFKKHKPFQILKKWAKHNVSERTQSGVNASVRSAKSFNKRMGMTTYVNKKTGQAYVGEDNKVMVPIEATVVEEK